MGTILAYYNYNGTIYPGRTTKQDKRHRPAKSPLPHLNGARNRLFDESGDECGYHTVCQYKKGKKQSWGRREMHTSVVLKVA